MDKSTMMTSLPERRRLTDSCMTLLPIEVQDIVYALLVYATTPTGGATVVSTFNKAIRPTGLF